MRIAFLLFYSATVFGFVNGNPGSPALTRRGIIPLKNKILSIRVAYLDDYVYAQHLQQQFVETSQTPAIVEKPPVSQLSTEAALLTMNFRSWADLYTILGSSKLQMDEEMFARRQFAWGVGVKTIIYEFECLRIGCDVKYFTTHQKPLFFVSSNLPLDIASSLWLNYREYQASLGLSYQSGIFCPYILGTYLSTKIEPNQRSFLVRVPGFEELLDAKIRSFIGANSWGLAVGASLLMGTKGTLSIESRFFNQNGINGNLEIRF